MCARKIPNKFAIRKVNKKKRKSAQDEGGKRGGREKGEEGKEIGGISQIEPHVQEKKHRRADDPVK